jgi:hypothetical protein
VTRTTFAPRWRLPPSREPTSCARSGASHRSGLTSQPHTFRRTYITFLIAGGYDLPYVQAQVGHSNPTITLGIYAQVIRRPDRDELRAEIRDLLGTSNQPGNEPRSPEAAHDLFNAPTSIPKLRAAETAGKGRRLTL